ncbi:MAG: creatininase family protein [Rhizobiales bacterium]|nr:creatininase family protein [Hyphomicrobiales bacterium]
MTAALPPSRLWMDLTTVEAAALPPETVALLPVTAVEQHGPHLPVGTDAYINRGIVARMLDMLPRDVPLLVLPEQTVGTSEEHRDFAGSLSHRPARLIEIWTDVLSCITNSPVRRLIIFNSHGGQTGLLAPATLELRVRQGLFAAYASWFDAGYPEGLFTDEEIHYGLHGGTIETSLMLAIRPDLVRMGKIADFPSRAIELDTTTRHLSANPGYGRLGGFGWKALDLQATGVTGNAAAATAEAGQKLLDHLAAALAALVTDMTAASLMMGDGRPL